VIEVKKEHLKKFRELVKKTRELQKEWCDFSNEVDFDVEVLINVTKVQRHGEETVWHDVCFDPFNISLKDLWVDYDMYVTRMYSTIINTWHYDIAWEDCINLQVVLNLR